ncbi:MAG TPA: hypothetical protein VN285_00745 [Candidatus Deferrimicrobium sp.]|nr:hypothetical protein [Candidatus Deferrimicrobium sp.]
MVYVLFVLRLVVLMSVFAAYWLIRYRGLFGSSPEMPFCNPQANDAIGSILHYATISLGTLFMAGYYLLWIRSKRRGVDDYEFNRRFYSQVLGLLRTFPLLLLYGMLLVSVIEVAHRLACD